MAVSAKTANLGAGSQASSQTQKRTGTTSTVSLDHKEGSLYRKTKPEKESIRGIPSVAKKPVPQKMTQEEVVPVQQPSTPPPASIEGVETQQDAYRFGRAIGIEDNLENSRVLGEEEDRIATISITADAGGELRRALEAGSTESFKGDVIDAYSRFFLQSVNEVQVEKYQIVETFTAFYTFFYGKRPPIYNYRGILLNDPNHKWTNDMMFFYDNFFRGTRSVELSAQAVLSYDGRLVSGFVLGLNIQQDAGIPKGAAFSLDVLVTDHVPVQFSDDIADLIRKAQDDLASEAQRIAVQISTVNRSIPTGERLTAISALNGKTSMSGATKKKSPKATKNPVSNKKKTS